MNVMEWITIVGIVVVNGGTLFAFFLNMNVKIAEINERYISLQKEVSEHKDDNKETFTELKNMLSENKKDNREDHSKLFDKLDIVSTQLSNATRTIIGNTK